MLPYQHVAWVGVTVHKAVDKDHLTIHLAQVAGDLKEKGGRWDFCSIWGNLFWFFNWDTLRGDQRDPVDLKSDERESFR